MDPSTYSPPSQPGPRKFVWLVILGLLVILAGAGFLWWKHAHPKYLVTITSSNGVSTSFGIPNQQNNSVATTLASTTSSATLEVAPGNYIAAFSANGYDSQTKGIVVSGPTSVTAPTLSYSQQKLAADLATQSSSIRTVLFSDPKLPGYTIAYQKLYGNEDWYAAVLSPSNPTLQDTYRVILNKTGGQWKIVAGPKLTFYLRDFPSVPESVIRDVNNH